VVTGTAGSIDEFERRINAAAAQGFRICGITVTAAIWGKPSAYAAVAVMTRAGAVTTGTTYRVIRRRGRRDD
jgi:hypothetical protein